MANASGIRAGRAYVEIYLKNAKFQQGLRTTQAEFSSWGRQMQSAANASTHAIALIGAPLGLSVKLLKEYDDAIRSVASVAGKAYAKTTMEAQRLAAITGQTVTSIKEQSKEMLELDKITRHLGATTSYTSKQIAESMIEMARAGLTIKEIKDSVKPIMDLARSTGTDIPKSASIAIAAMRSFQIEAKKMSEVVDILSVTANRSPQTLEDLGYAMKYVGPVARAVNVSLKETARDLGLLANFALKGEQGGAALRNIYMRLADVKNQIKYKEVFGVDVIEKETGEFRKLTDIFADTQRQIKTLGLSTVEVADAFKKIFSMRALAASFSLSTASVEEMTKALDGAAEYSSKTAKEIDAGLGGTFRMFLSRMQDLGLLIAESIAPSLDKLLTFFVNAIDEAKPFLNILKPLILGLTALGTAVISFSLTSAFLGQTSKFFGSLFAQANKLSGLTYNNLLNLFKAKPMRNPFEGVRLDTIDRAQEATRLLSSNLSVGSKRAQSTEQKFTKLYLTFGRVAEKSKVLSSSFDKLTLNINGNKQTIKTFESNVRDFNKAIGSSNASTKTFLRRVTSLNLRLKTFNNYIGETNGKLAAFGNNAVTFFEKGTTRISEESKKAIDSLTNLHTKIDSLISLAVSSKTYFDTFCSSIRSIGGSVSTIVNSLDSFAKNSNALVDSLSKVSAPIGTLGDSLAKVAGGSKSISSILKQFSIKLTDAAGALRISNAEFASSDKAFDIYRNGLIEVAKQVDTTIQKINALHDLQKKSKTKSSSKKEEKSKEKEVKSDAEKPAVATAVPAPTKEEPKRKPKEKIIFSDQLNEIATNLIKYDEAARKINTTSTTVKQAVASLAQSAKKVSDSLGQSIRKISTIIRRINAFDTAIKTIQTNLENFSFWFVKSMQAADNDSKVPIENIKASLVTLGEEIKKLSGKAVNFADAFGKTKFGSFVSNINKISTSIEAIANSRVNFVGAIIDSGSAFTMAATGATTYADALARIVGSQRTVASILGGASGVVGVSPGRKRKITRSATATSGTSSPKSSNGNQNQPIKTPETETKQDFTTRVNAQNATYGTSLTSLVDSRRNAFYNVRQGFLSWKKNNGYVSTGDPKADQKLEKKAWNEYKKTDDYKEHFGRAKALDKQIRTRTQANQSVSSPVQRAQNEYQDARNRYKVKFFEYLGARNEWKRAHGGSAKGFNSSEQGEELVRSLQKARGKATVAKTTIRSLQQTVSNPNPTRAGFVANASINAREAATARQNVAQAKADVETAKANVNAQAESAKIKTAALDAREKIANDRIASTNLRMSGGLSQEEIQQRVASASNQYNIGSQQFDAARGTKGFASRYGLSYSSTDEGKFLRDNHDRLKAIEEKLIKKFKSSRQSIIDRSRRLQTVEQVFNSRKAAYASSNAPNSDPFESTQQGARLKAEIDRLRAKHERNAKVYRSALDKIRRVRDNRKRAVDAFNKGREKYLSEGAKYSDTREGQAERSQLERAQALQGGQRGAVISERIARQDQLAAGREYRRAAEKWKQANPNSKTKFHKTKEGIELASKLKSATTRLRESRGFGTEIRSANQDLDQIKKERGEVRRGVRESQQTYATARNNLTIAESGRQVATAKTNADIRSASGFVVKDGMSPDAIRGINARISSGLQGASSILGSFSDATKLGNTFNRDAKQNKRNKAIFQRLAPQIANISPQTQEAVGSHIKAANELREAEKARATEARKLSEMQKLQSSVKKEDQEAYRKQQERVEAANKNAEIKRAAFAQSTQGVVSSVQSEQQRRIDAKNALTNQADEEKIKKNSALRTYQRETGFLSSSQSRLSALQAENKTNNAAISSLTQSVAKDRADIQASPNKFDELKKSQQAAVSQRQQFEKSFLSRFSSEEKGRKVLSGNKTYQRLLTNERVLSAALAKESETRERFQRNNEELKKRTQRRDAIKSERDKITRSVKQIAGTAMTAKTEFNTRANNEATLRGQAAGINTSARISESDLKAFQSSQRSYGDIIGRNAGLISAASAARSELANPNSPIHARGMEGVKSSFASGVALSDKLTNPMIKPSETKPSKKEIQGRQDAFRRYGRALDAKLAADRRVVSLSSGDPSKMDDKQRAKLEEARAAQKKAASDVISSRRAIEKSSNVPLTSKQSKNIASSEKFASSYLDNIGKSRPTLVKGIVAARNEFNTASSDVVKKRNELRQNERLSRSSNPEDVKRFNEIKKSYENALARQSNAMNAFHRGIASLQGELRLRQDHAVKEARRLGAIAKTDANAVKTLEKELAQSEKKRSSARSFVAKFQGLIDNSSSFSNKQAKLDAHIKSINDEKEVQKRSQAVSRLQKELNDISEQRRQGVKGKGIDQREANIRGQLKSAEASLASAKSESSKSSSGRLSEKTAESLRKELLKRRGVLTRSGFSSEEELRKNLQGRLSKAESFSDSERRKEEGLKKAKERSEKSSKAAAIAKQTAATATSDFRTSRQYAQAESVAAGARILGQPLTTETPKEKASLTSRMKDAAQRALKYSRNMSSRAFSHYSPGWVTGAVDKLKSNADFRDRTTVSNISRRLEKSSVTSEQMKSVRAAQDRQDMAGTRLFNAEKDVERAQRFASSSDPAVVKKYKELVSARDTAKTDFEKAKKTTSAAWSEVASALKKSGASAASELSSISEKIKAAKEKVSEQKTKTKEAFSKIKEAKTPDSWKTANEKYQKERGALVSAEKELSQLYQRRSQLTSSTGPTLKDFQQLERAQRRIDGRKQRFAEQDAFDKEQDRKWFAKNNNYKPSKINGIFQSIDNAFVKVAKNFGFSVNDLADGTQKSGKKVRSEASRMRRANVMLARSFGAIGTAAKGLMKSFGGMMMGMGMGMLAGAAIAGITNLCKSIFKLGETTEDVANRILKEANRIGVLNEKEKSTVDIAKGNMSRIKELSSKKSLSMSEVNEIFEMKRSNEVNKTGFKEYDEYLANLNFQRLSDGNIVLNDALTDKKEESISKSMDDHLKRGYFNQADELSKSIKELEDEKNRHVALKEDYEKRAKLAAKDNQYSGTVQGGFGSSDFGDGFKSVENYDKKIAEFNEQITEAKKKYQEVTSQIAELNKNSEATKIDTEAIKLRTNSSYDEFNQTVDAFNKGSDVDVSELINSYSSVVTSVREGVKTMTDELNTAANSNEFSGAIADAEAKLASAKKTVELTLAEAIEEIGDPVGGELNKSLKEVRKKTKTRMASYGKIIDAKKTLAGVERDEKISGEKDRIISEYNKKHGTKITKEDLTSSVSSVQITARDKVKKEIEESSIIWSNITKEFDDLSKEEKNAYTGAEGIKNFSERYKKIFGEDIPDEILKSIQSKSGKALYQISKFGLDQAEKDVKGMREKTSGIKEINDNVSSSSKLINDEYAGAIKNLNQQQASGFKEIIEDAEKEFNDKLKEVTMSYAVGLSKDKLESDKQKEALDKSKEEYVNIAVEGKVAKKIAGFDSTIAQYLSYLETGEREISENASLSQEEKMKRIEALRKATNEKIGETKKARAEFNEEEFRKEEAAKAIKEFEPIYNEALKNIDNEFQSKVVETYNSILKSFDSQEKLTENEHKKRQEMFDQAIKFYGEDKKTVEKLKAAKDRENKIYLEEKKAREERDRNLSYDDFMNDVAVGGMENLNFTKEFNESYDAARKNINDLFLQASVDLDNQEFSNPNDKKKKIKALEKRRDEMLRNVEESRQMNFEEDKRRKENSIKDITSDFLSSFALIDPTKIDLSESIKRSYDDLREAVIKNFLTAKQSIEASDLPEATKQHQKKLLEEQKEALFKSIEDSKKVAMAMETESLVQRSQSYAKTRRKMTEGSASNKVLYTDDAIFQSEAIDAKQGLSEDSNRTKLLKQQRSFLTYQQTLEELSFNENKLSRAKELYRQADLSNASIEEKEKAQNLYEEALSERKTLQGDLLESIKGVKEAKESIQKSEGFRGFNKMETSSTAATTNAYELVGQRYDWQKRVMTQQSTYLEKIAKNTEVDSKMI